MFKKLELNIMYLLCISIQIYPDYTPSQQNYPNLAKLIATYRCSDEIIKKMEQHQVTITSDEKDNYFLKPGMNRLINARKMINCIKTHNLYHLDVAPKCLIFKDGSLNTVSTKVDDVTNTQPISISQVQQMAKFTTLTRFTDWGLNDGYDKNVHRNNTGQFIFIDTENASFSPEDPIQALQDFLNPQNMTPQAHAWINQIQPNNANGSVILPSNSAYDDPDIDFQQVKKEYELWQSRCG